MQDVTNPVGLPSLCCTSYLPLLLDYATSFHFSLTHPTDLRSSTALLRYCIYHRLSHINLKKRI